MKLSSLIYEMTVNKEIEGWSDLHIQENKTLAFRDKSGSIAQDELLEDKSNIVSFSDIEELVSPAFDMDEGETFSLKKLMKEKEGDVDFALSISNPEDPDEKPKRFRCNLHYFGGRRVGLIMRKINDGAPDIERLGLPALARTFKDKSAGLILVTGPTGSGKSTTLASMIEEMNEKRDEHIVTVEDPIEYVFEPKSCRVTQREVGSGKDSGSFANALRAALRQDPDIILVGEIRDSETANMALEASQTGHLVLGTLHTKDSVSTINRFVQMFASGDRGRVRDVLADSLIGVISQILVPKIGGGKVLACEVMGVNGAIRACIRSEEKQAEIVNYIETGQRETGMIRLNGYLLDLVVNNMITPEDAVAYCVDVQNMIKKLQGKGITVSDDSSKEVAVSKPASAPSSEKDKSKENAPKSLSKTSKPMPAKKPATRPASKPPEPEEKTGTLGGLFGKKKR
jgi:twitching motility protein PilT